MVDNDKIREKIDSHIEHGTYVASTFGLSSTAAGSFEEAKELNEKYGIGIDPMDITMAEFSANAAYAHKQNLEFIKRCGEERKEREAATQS